MQVLVAVVALPLVSLLLALLTRVEDTLRPGSEVAEPRHLRAAVAPGYDVSPLDAEEALHAASEAA
jgi:hypothetical protein